MSAASASPRLEGLTSWHSDWAGLRVAVLGLGSTGFAVADTLAELGCAVRVVAERSDEERQTVLDVLDVGFILQTQRDVLPDDLAAFDPELVIVSPGYHPDHPLIERFASAGVPIWGDVELAWRVRDKVEAADWILVTGTNGKTTTARLTGHLLRSAGLRAVEVGNIGTPVLDAVRRPEGFDILVVELSSYQLHWLPLAGPGALHPLAAVCLNVADDHLDWHGSRSAYEAAKGRVYANARIAAVYNRGDAATIRMVEDAEVEEGCRAIGFDLGSPGPSEFGIVDGILVDRAFLDDRHHQALEITTVPELAEHGIDSPHLVANVLAAAALARAAGAPIDSIHDGLSTFRLDPHRTQVIATAEGVTWIDDSKATNPHAAHAALVARTSVVWVVGGLLKGVDISELVATHAGRLRAAVVIGEDRAALRDALARHAPGVEVLEVVTGEDGGVMPEAVRLAAGVARTGDTVLLSPAAASMDQFADYADRGRKFADAVRQMLGGGSDDDAATTPPRKSV